MEIKKYFEWQRFLKNWHTLEGEPKKIELIAGADVAYDLEKGLAFGAIVVGLLNEIWEQIDSFCKVGEISYPYFPGMLSFREVPVLVKAFAGLKTIPDVILVDGHGIAHPRGMGLASHLGLILDIPTIGCAKSRLIGEYEEPDTYKGSSSFLTHNQEIIGIVLRTRSNINPLFVSPGYRMSLQKAKEIVLKTCYHTRIPEPIRAAHHLAIETRNKSKSKGNRGETSSTF